MCIRDRFRECRWALPAWRSPARRRTTTRSSCSDLRAGPASRASAAYTASDPGTPFARGPGEPLPRRFRQADGSRDRELRRTPVYDRRPDPDAVSYTHLDVYKRQAGLRRSGRLELSPEGMPSDQAIPRVRDDRGNRRLSSHIRIGSHAVSYTHLDVYKRQRQEVRAPSGVPRHLSIHSTSGLSGCDTGFVPRTPRLADRRNSVPSRKR